MTASDKLEKRLEEADAQFRKLEKWKQDLLEARMQRLGSPLDKEPVRAEGSDS